MCVEFFSGSKLSHEARASSPLTISSVSKEVLLEMVNKVQLWFYTDFYLLHNRQPMLFAMDWCVTNLYSCIKTLQSVICIKVIAIFHSHTRNEYH